MSNKQNINVKKRLMFNKEEDYYFITYNIFVFLNTLGCEQESSRFFDYAKLTYVIPFLSNQSLLDIVVNYNGSRPQKNEEIELLRETYYKSRLKLKLVTSILFALERNEYIALKKNPKRNAIDIWIRKDNIPETFFNPTLYKIEIEHTRKLKEVMPRIRTLTVGTLLEQLFGNKGVSVWQV